MYDTILNSSFVDLKILYRVSHKLLIHSIIKKYYTPISSLYISYHKIKIANYFIAKNSCNIFFFSNDDIKLII